MDSSERCGCGSLIVWSPGKSQWLCLSCDLGVERDCGPVGIGVITS